MKRIIFYLLLFYTLQGASQNISYNILAGEWKVVDIVFAESIEFEAKHKKIINEYKNSILYFSGEGHFNIFYSGNNTILKEDIQVYQDENWYISNMKNEIILENEEIYYSIPIKMVTEKVAIIEFVANTKFKLEKIKNEEINFKQNFEGNPYYMPMDKKLDTILKFVEVDLEKVRNTKVKIKPIFKGCEKFTDAANLNNCNATYLNKRISKEIISAKYKDSNDSNYVKVYINYVIDKDGLVKNIEIKSTNKFLTHDLKILFNNLEVISPGVNEEDKPILFMYSLPLTLR
ncbi:hypothetical protein [Cellulophaga sp. Asnod2-G02]|uniref:hypothetical protein n=1 Tax=Cellulophaga sp. Asnod2-G02 TaxID=3160572 RepID=UPI003866702E